MNFLALLMLCVVFHLSFCEILNCRFKDHTFYRVNFYTCFVTSFDITINNVVITGHNGVHEPNKNDTDVKAIYIQETDTKYIPENLGRLFNLTVLWIGSTQIFEVNDKRFQGMINLEQLFLNSNKLTSIPLNTLIDLMKLKIISLSSNRIEDLPNGIFKNNLNLEQIKLFNNKIKFLGSTLFDGLTKLYHVDLEGNVCINKWYKDITEMVQLKKDIKTQCFYSNENPPTTTTQEPKEIQQILLNQQNVHEKELDKLCLMV